MRDVALYGERIARTVRIIQLRCQRPRVNILGFSMGAAYGPIFLALEERIKVAVLIAGGLYWFRTPPESEVINFALSASVRAMTSVGTFRTSAARRAATSVRMKCPVGTSTFPPKWPHFFSEAS